MGQQLEEKFLALCLEEGAGLIQLPPDKPERNLNLHQTASIRAKEMGGNENSHRTGRSRCEHIPWWWVSAGGMGGRLWLGLPAPITQTNSFLPWWRKNTVNEWRRQYNSYVHVEKEDFLSLYLSLCLLEEAAGGFHPEGSTGHPPVEIMAVWVHLLQVGHGCLLHAGY